MLAKGL